MVKSGLLARLQNQLEEAGIPYDSIGGVQPNPLMSLARKGIQQALEFKADFILAVGGGSVIDTSKAIAHGIADPEVDIWEYWSGKRPITKTTPVGVVLTISAAGSETSNSAVLTNDEIGKKCGTNTDLNRPRFAIMNPELTYTLPPYQIACGTADIIMHTLERYMTHTDGNNFTDRVAEELIKNVMKFGKKALASYMQRNAVNDVTITKVMPLETVEPMLVRDAPSAPVETVSSGDSEAPMEDTPAESADAENVSLYL